MKAWRGVAAWGLIGLMALNIFGIAYYFVLQRQIQSARQPPNHEVGSKFPSFGGVDVMGVKWKSGDAPCRVLRVTEDSCEFCRRDKVSYAALLDAARSASCEIVELAPKAGKMAPDPRPGVVQLKYVDADVGTFLFPFVTPQTVILDRDWSLRLNRRGIFDKESLSDAVTLLAQLGAEPRGGKSMSAAAR